MMTKTISRDELKQKIDRKDDFLLVETLPAIAYHMRTCRARSICRQILPPRDQSYFPVKFAHI